MLVVVLLAGSRAGWVSYGWVSALLAWRLARGSRQVFAGWLAAALRSGSPIAGLRFEVERIRQRELARMMKLHLQSLDATEKRGVLLRGVEHRRRARVARDHLIEHHKIEYACHETAPVPAHHTRADDATVTPLESPRPPRA